MLQGHLGMFNVPLQIGGDPASTTVALVDSLIDKLRFSATRGTLCNAVPCAVPASQSGNEPELLYATL